MSHFSKHGKYIPELHNKELEEFNIYHTQKNLEVATKTLTVARITLIISVAALLVALFK